MAANLSTQPPSLAYAGDPVWTEVETDLLTGAAAYFEITITDGGPASTETLSLSWPGGSVAYEVGSADPSLNWPEQFGAPLADYTNTVAEFLRYREDVGAVFDISIVSAGVIRLTRKVVEPFDISVDADTMTNIAVTANDGTAASPEDNLRAYVEVWTYTGDFNTDRRLLTLHSPYDISRQATDVDLSAAFAHLGPHLPDTATINPSSPPASLPWALASDCFLQYLLRVADKYGSPAVAEALYPWGPYTALHGSRSLEAFTTGAVRLLHNYRRRDGADFRKPVGEDQPDWVYYLPGGGQDVFVRVTVYWSDGTSSTYEPWGTTTVALADAKVYWFVSGFRQLLLHSLAPSGGTDPDAYIVAYDWLLRTASSTLATVSYEVLCDTPWAHYLLFDNGKGGMETVWLRGKASEGYDVAGAETYRKPYAPDRSLAAGDFDAFGAEARPQWSFSTGWYDDPFYCEHLRQVLLSGSAWIVDTLRNRLLKVIVDAKSIDEVRPDDETLYALTFTARAAWVEKAANL